MKDVNLLPEELKPKTYARGFARKLRKVAFFLILASFGVFVLMTFSFAALIWREKSIVAYKNSLISQARVYEASEQRLVLASDRLHKIGNILNSDNFFPLILVYKSIQAVLPENVNIDSVEVKDGVLQVVFSAERSKDLSNLFSILAGLELKNVFLKSFSYTPDVGYKVAITIANSS
jgi:hypothetical protein